MLEKFVTTMALLTIACASVGGWVWVQGPPVPGSETSSVAQPTLADDTRDLGYGYGNPEPDVTAEPAPSTAPSPRLTTGPTRTAPRGSTPSSIPVAPAPVAATPAQGGADFTVATFNLLGSSHTKGSHTRASGPARMTGALEILAQHQVSVVGLQEFQSDQRAAFRSGAPGWETYPGESVGHGAGENSVAWRSDTWELVKAAVVAIPYFNGRERSMPYVLLRNKASGAQAYFSNFHNPADTNQFRNQQRWRDEATTREIELFNRLAATGVPQFVTGDMNERSEYFCRVTAGTTLVAAAGGSTGTACQPPKPTQIDWILGSKGVTFSDFTIDRSALARRTTDHPVVVAHVTIPS
jgi:endonuclease/exonuclease/phosphatase family metal-dependent hydrolase